MRVREEHQPHDVAVRRRVVDVLVGGFDDAPVAHVLAQLLARLHLFAEALPLLLVHAGLHPGAGQHEPKPASVLGGLDQPVGRMPVTVLLVGTRLCSSSLSVSFLFVSYSCVIYLFWYFINRGDKTRMTGPLPWLKSHNLNCRRKRCSFSLKL